jgi:predicted Zn finger-like uncharacterized protein
MNLTCPKCHTVFQVDESDYAAILQQVRNQEFEAEIERRLTEIHRQYDAEGKAKTLEIEKLNEQRLADKDRAMGELEKEIERLKATVENFEASKKAELAEANTKLVQKMTEASAKKDLEISDLKSQIEMLRKQNELNVVNERNACKDELHAKEQAITELNSKIEAQAVAAENKVHEINERHAVILKAKDEEIEHYKDMKIRMSTKMLGETLEQHCQNMFNRARSNGQFPNAYFEKDNDTSIGGTKGDFIFRDYLNGEEYISIMFEMKNEADTTATKHHNEDFFQKLDKDRTDKKCEYAVLVTTLEADNELYNEGIVDVSYRYDKMIVIRPQFFMSVIVMLSRAAMRGARNLIDLKHQLAVAQAQSIDVTNFEARRDKFVADFGKLVEAHLKKQDDALEGIDKAIAAAEKQVDTLRKVKDLFEVSRKKLEDANDKANNDFTIRKLTRGNKTMQAKFEEARALNASTDDSHDLLQ